DIDRALLPSDAQFKGYELYFVQGLKIVAENTCFRRAKYYSPSTGKTYLAPLPAGYFGHFTPDLRAICVYLAYSANMSHAAIQELLINSGVQISAGEVSRLLVEDLDTFHDESAE